MLALLGAGLIAACRGSDDGPAAERADAPLFWDVAGAPAGGGAAIEGEHYNSLRSLTSAADLVLRARTTGTARQGHFTGTVPSEPRGVTVIVELEVLEVLAGDQPASEPVELSVALGLEDEVDVDEAIRQIEAAEPEEAVYFLRSGTWLADTTGNSQDEKLRGLYTVQTSQALIANRDSVGVFPGLESYEDEAAGDPVAADLHGEPYAEVLEEVEAEVGWREENPEAADAERVRMLSRYYAGDVD